MGLFGGLRNIAGNIVDLAGTALGLPEFGLSEALAGGSTINTKGTASAPTTTTSPAVAPGTTAVSGSSTGKRVTTEGSAANAAADKNASDYAASQAGQAQADTQRTQQLIAEENAAIDEQFTPVFQALDQKAGLLPDQRKELENNIAELAGMQTSGVEADTAAAKSKLEGNKSSEVSKAESGLRDLADNIQNLVMAQQQRLGATGSADSSAATQSSEAITRIGARERNKRLTSRDEALAAIDQKKIDVDTLASSEKRKIDMWKATKLQDVASWYTDQFTAITDAKAEAGVNRAQAKRETALQLKTDLMSRLRTIDDRVSSFKQSVDQWKVERQAGLEDYQNQLSAAAAYQSSTATPTKLQFLTDPITGQQRAVNPYTGEEVLNYGTSSLPSSEKKSTGLLGAIGSLFGNNDNSEE